MRSSASTRASTATRSSPWRTRCARPASRSTRPRRRRTSRCGTSSPTPWAPQPTAPPQPETERCVEAWTAGRDALEALVASFAIESGQPAISRTKLEGLVEHYGIDEGPATEYFALHAERDLEHAAQSRALIEERLEGADHERLLAVAEGTLRGNWELLDGVERCFGRTTA